MKKNKGMKIYKQRKKKRGNNYQILSILGTVSLVFGAGIFGYYVIAVPIRDVIQSLRENPDTVTTQNSEISEVEFTTAATTYDKVLEDIKITTGTRVTVPVTSEVSDETLPPVTTVVTEEVTEAPATTVVTTTSPATAVVKGGCYYLSVSDITDLDSLASKLDSISGCSSVAIPLKTTGGYVNYASSVRTAALSGAVRSDISLNDIVNLINEKGFTPVAELSTIADNIYPVTYKKSAYQFDDGYTGEWLDNKPESGGKPWLSPFSSETIDYLSALVDEITSAGIKSVICTDTYFPPFREKDLNYIGELVKSENRYKGLTELINKLNDKAVSNGGKTMISVSASEIINSSSEVFKPEEFGSMSVVVNINMNEFNGETVSSVLKKVSEKTGNMKIVPCIIKESVADSGVSNAINGFKTMGYELYMIK